MAILPSPKSGAWNHTDPVTPPARRIYTLLRLMAPLHPLVALLAPGAGLYRKGTLAMLTAMERSSYGAISPLTQLIRNSANVTSVAMASRVVVVAMGSRGGVAPSLNAVTPQVGEAAP